ncbi:UNKNOWN [Stylonychia lemnae]|uniref:Uncharacterized protein n=1 Tax=Stylonychia lemnae TaxID=5949 RepID=A0A078AL05_STYLE|nr:UNKNOWN [Stylonychia lemnae]|eukprot:CDW82561.1 UNKNOWN [Stylonychia lemnae]
MTLPQEGDRAFIKHVGEVQFIENGSLKVNIVKNQKDEITKDKYQLKAIAELQESSLKSLVGEVEDKYEKQKVAKQNIIDKLQQMKEQLTQMIPEKQQQIQVSMNEAEQETQLISQRVHNLMKMRDQIRNENLQLKDELNFQEKNQADSVRLFCDELKKKSYEMIFVQKKIQDKNNKKLKEMLQYSETNNKRHEEFNDNLKLQLDTTKQHRGVINEKIVGSRKTVRELMEEYLEELGFYANSKRTLEQLIDEQDFDQIRRILKHRKFSNYRIKEFRLNLDLLQQEINDGVQDTAKTFRKEYLSNIPANLGSIEYQTASTQVSTARNKEQQKKGSNIKSSKMSSIRKSNLEFN